MRVALVHTWFDPAARTGAEVIALDTTRRGIARALSARGHEVHVVQEGPTDERITAHGATWHFHRPTRASVLVRGALRAAGRPWPLVHAPAGVGPLRELRPDVVHSFDLTFPLALLATSRVCRELGVPLVGHYHGGQPSRFVALERRAMAGLAAACFTDVSRASAFPLDRAAVRQVVETSTDFGSGPRAALVGNPVVFCPGRLDPVKDPLTTLRGFRRFLDVSPEAMLYLAYTDDLLLEMCRREAGDRVVFLGRLPATEMAAVFNAADLVVQSSLREVCGVAILEAMACGATPVVTDIPAFRVTTGEVGRRFPVGDVEALAAALARGPVDRGAVRRHFASSLSFEALAARLETVYNSCQPMR